jgi:hypothetical protein
MDTLTLTEFDERVARAADKMVAALEEFNQGQAHAETALCSAEDLRAEFVEYFRELLSSEIEITVGEQADFVKVGTDESTNALLRGGFAHRGKKFESSES